jgi:hypothetical protein
MKMMRKRKRMELQLQLQCHEFSVFVVAAKMSFLQEMTFPVCRPMAPGAGVGSEWRAGT